MTGLDQVTVEAPAKVNLTLEVLGKRDDGYHEIASVMQTISLFDTLTFSPSDHICVSTDVLALDTQDNLVYRAAMLLKNETHVSYGANIALAKKVPVAAGLGGGSSNAAATLLGLDRLWELGYSKDELSGLAAQLGSDVPFFVKGGAALVEGRGECVSTLPTSKTLWLILAFPGYHLENKTAAAYTALSRTDYTDGRKTAELVERIDASAAITHDSLFNVFDSVAPQIFPGIDDERSILRKACGGRVHLSGAGPTLFCLVNGTDEGERIVKECAARGLDCCLVRTLAPAEGPHISTNE